jgi:acetyl-CoA synthetase
MSTEISSHLKEEREFSPSEDFRKRAKVSDADTYESLYRWSVESPEEFWDDQAEKNLHWFKKWDKKKVLSYDFDSIGEKSEPYLKWFEGGELNVSYNCLDRHVEAGKGNRVAIHWQGEDEKEERTITYADLLDEVCRFSNVLKKLGVKRGTTVTVYMPMVPELAVAVLACARIGAIHSVVFSAFSAEALRGRLQDSNSEVVVTADAGFHGGKVVLLKNKVDEAIAPLSFVRHVIVLNRAKQIVSMNAPRDVWWHEQTSDISAECAAESMEAESPLFMLYTSGSTGKPKGVLHTTAGYLLYTNLTFKYVFDYHEDDVFWCTADVGWITGHSYLVYGPLSNCATVVMFEGVPTYPQPNRFWSIIERYKVTIFYTAPTAIRALMRIGDQWPRQHNLSSLRLLGTVGEPINPEAWVWYHRTIGEARCPVVDTWWQTETGGVLITTLPGAHVMKPGSAGRPFFGVVPRILKDDGREAGVNEGGSLCIVRPWPGMLRGIFGDAQNSLVKNVYFSKFLGVYFTGDGCRKDEDGYYWLLGRIDDVINVSAHRFATAEIESALVGHEHVAEAAVVGFPHETKGQGIYCFVTVKQDRLTAEQLSDGSYEKVLKEQVRREIGPIATPDYIHFTIALPKTRSGKIMRRILRKIAEGKIDEIGDTSTLADPAVVEELLKTRPRMN